MENIRAFVAIELEEGLHQELARVQASLKEKIPQGQVRWVNTQGIHLTLKFLGQVPNDKIPDIVAALNKATRGIGPFAVAFGGLGCFPSMISPSVIWVGTQTFDETLARLQANIEAEMEPLGYPREGRPFSPHLTLGRVARNARYGARRALGGVIASMAIGELGRMEVQGISLMKSTLHPTGAEYSRLHSAPLLG